MPHDSRRLRPAFDRHQDALAGWPGAVDGVAAHVVDHLIVDTLRGTAQRQLPQGG